MHGRGTDGATWQGPQLPELEAPYLNIFVGGIVS